MLESKITNAFQPLLDRFLDQTPFFRVWKGGGVNQGISRKFLVSFDSLVKSFPSLIAAGAARALDEKTRSVLAVNLFQECGEGDVRRSHHAIYRKYLATAGLNGPLELEESFAVQWRVDLMGYIQDGPSPLSALGALAAGEFLAQPVLSRVYPLLKDIYPGADEEYFTKHLDLETEHVREITDLLVEQITDERKWGEVLEGFQFGLSVWETYFEKLAEHIQKDNIYSPLSRKDSK